MAEPQRCIVHVDGQAYTGKPDQPLVDFLAAQKINLPHVCYHPSLGAIKTCVTCWVRVGGKLVCICELRTA